MTATISTIRDRIYAVIEALTPTTDVKVLFRRSKNEGAASFVEWSEANQPACYRRFQVRDDGADDGPDVSNTDVDMRHVTFVIRVAYPQSARFGADQAMDRDDVIDRDYTTINYAIGLYGRGSFSGAYDCTPLGAPKEIERGAGVDILAMRARYSFYRQTT